MIVTTNPLLSSERFDWQTPEWFINLVRQVDHIALDPATSPDNPTKSAELYTQLPGECGLSKVWQPTNSGLVFCNPPYGRHLSGPINPTKQIIYKGELVGVGTGWAIRMSQYQGQALYLVPTRTETDWWKRLLRWSDDCLLWSSKKYGRRINFKDPSTGKIKQGSTIASTVFYKGTRYHREKFVEIFGPHGTLVHMHVE